MSMIRFARAGNLEAHLKRVEHLGAQGTVPVGNVLYYVLIEQFDQHTTVVTMKDITCMGYSRSYLNHDRLSQQEGGVKGTKFLLEHGHLLQKVKMLKAPVLLKRNARTGVCLEVWEGRKVIQSLKVREYPGSIADFEQAVGEEMPDLTSRVRGFYWRAACNCVKLFSKPESNPNVRSQNNQPLMLTNEGMKLTLTAFYKDHVHMALTCTLPLLDAPLVEGGVLVPLANKFINRMLNLGGEYVYLGYDSEKRCLGFASEDFECTTLQQETSGLVERFHQQFVSSLQTVCKRYVAVKEAWERVGACQPEAVEGVGVVLLEKDGDLQVFPERNLYGENYALISILPGLNEGKWVPIIATHEHLKAALGTLWTLIRQLRISVDLYPPACLELMQAGELLVLRLGLIVQTKEGNQLRDELVMQVYVRVQACVHAMDLLDLRE